VNCNVQARFPQPPHWCFSLCEPNTNLKLRMNLIVNLGMTLSNGTNCCDDDKTRTQPSGKFQIEILEMDKRHTCGTNRWIAQKSFTTFAQTSGREIIEMVIRTIWGRKTMLIDGDEDVCRKHHVRTNF
jgi:hypothetical protein